MIAEKRQHGARLRLLVLGRMLRGFFRLRRSLSVVFGGVREDRLPAGDAGADKQSGRQPHGQTPGAALG